MVAFELKSTVSKKEMMQEDNKLSSFKLLDCNKQKDIMKTKTEALGGRVTVLFFASKEHSWLILTTKSR